MFDSLSVLRVDRHVKVWYGSVDLHFPPVRLMGRLLNGLASVAQAVSSASRRSVATVARCLAGHAANGCQIAWADPPQECFQAPAILLAHISLSGDEPGWG